MQTSQEISGNDLGRTALSKLGSMTEKIEKQAAKIPSDIFLWAATGAVGLSLLRQFSDARKQTRFIFMRPRSPSPAYLGLLAPTLLLLGVYNKLSKMNQTEKGDWGVA